MGDMVCLLEWNHVYVGGGWACTEQWRVMGWPRETVRLRVARVGVGGTEWER